MSISTLSEKAAEFKVYKAAAGSGKTYTLAKEFIALAISERYHFRHILAVTFTNKATQEMKDRMLLFMHEIAQGRQEEMCKDIAQNYLGLSEQEVKRRCAEELKNILHAYSQFRVTTIDSFFQEVVRAFAKDLGLHGDARIELDQASVMENVVERLMNKLGRDAELTSWMVAFAEEKLEHNERWDVRDGLQRFASQLLSEEFKVFEEALRQQVKEEDKIKSFRDVLQKIVGNFENRLDSIGKKAMGLIEQHGLSLEAFPYKASSFASFFVKIQEERKDYKAGSRVLAAQDEPSKWMKKKNDPNEAAITALFEPVNALLKEAISIVQEDYGRYFICKMVRSQVYYIGLFARILEELQAYREEQNMMLISDTSDFLKKIIYNGAGEDQDFEDSPIPPYIYERVGSKYAHFLIDEFQDTSGFQWKNFRPLITNALAEGHTSLVVGDVKQSIYRWRNGDWRLLLNQIYSDIQNPRPTDCLLDTNWRSYQNIIEFNNALFQEAPVLLADFLRQGKGDLSAEGIAFVEEKADDIEKAYEGVAQRVSPGKLAHEVKGFVESHFIKLENSRSSTEFKEKALEKLPSLLEHYFQNGYRPKDISFLVRTKSEGQEVAARLLAYGQDSGQEDLFRVVSSESLYIGEASSVQLLLASMRWLVKQEDPQAIVQLVFAYQQVFQSEIDQHACFVAGVEDPLFPQAVKEACHSFLKLPLFELAEQLIDLLGICKSEEGIGNVEIAYVQAFLDAVMEFSQGEYDDLNAFLEWWDKTGARKAIRIPDSLDAMQIMTIHKSKGLEFRIVVVPFCNWDMDHSATKAPTLWASADQAPLNALERVPVRYTKDLAQSPFWEDYLEEWVKIHFDNLNILYVATTRAEEGLLTLSPQSKGEKISNAADLLKMSLQRFGEEAQWELGEEGDIYRRGTIGSAEIKDKKGKQERILKKLSFFDWRNDRLKISRQSEILNQDFLETEEKVNYGVLVHDILSRIRTIDQVENALSLARMEGEIDAEQEGQLKKQIDVLMKNPLVASWFAPGPIIKTEVPVLPKEGKAVRLDRVVLSEDSATIVDYKTGLEKSQDIRQVQSYMYMMRDMGYKQVKGYLLYLNDGRTKEVFIKKAKEDGQMSLF
ncbi:exodeoxyribonuclease V subunit beta [Persicobacter sp. CCB-QB2]|uniref:UvrD-helicase domain-containing protein n=1 Tax=Persicobacter sp. CCB-QB2 TaxID=1561025 RepID=UPI0006A9F5DC|nr:UvrD-helicase domain-containing protein [Persicobacter sp. CCB-QB2]